MTSMLRYELSSTLIPHSQIVILCLKFGNTAFHRLNAGFQIFVHLAGVSVVDLMRCVSNHALLLGPPLGKAPFMAPSMRRQGTLEESHESSSMDWHQRTYARKFLAISRLHHGCTTCDPFQVNLRYSILL